jgi:hypothetical protein
MEHIATKSDFDGDRTFAFIWDIDKELSISSYGSNEKALLYGGFYSHGGGPVAAILITEPSTKNVLVENLTLEMWAEATIVVSETEDVILRNIKLERVGTYYFTDEKDKSSFFPSGIYPKNSSRILMEDIVMIDVLNIKGDRGGLHGFYCTRLADSEIRNCTLINVCGSAFKVRREPHGRGPNNIYIHDNECYYTGTSNLSPPGDDVQPGFLRYSGEYYNDDTPNCPSGIVIENNILHYPFVWENEGEDPNKAHAFKCSVSNKKACGDGVCADNPDKVKWVNNDIKYKWEKSELWTGRNTVAPSAPTQLNAISVGDNQVDLSWNHDMVNGERFIIHRKEKGKEYEAIRIVGADVTSYSDKGLKKSTQYTYRIKACHDAACSEYSNEATSSTIQKK